ncbi:transcription factor-like protein [Actinidia rufa]|uniref:RNA polymerase II transcription factor B subunit 2 n=1 Tax=Actinidia rufa TaxID=165716 RepID=A0A7J0E0V6_9ERIC|nr:transcription factor-like protein [Actinidia rufa]
MPQVKIIAKNFMDMVASLPAVKLDKLYHNAFICEAILRSSLVKSKSENEMIGSVLLEVRVSVPRARGAVRLAHDASTWVRSLPPLAKKYVLQMLYIDVPLSAKLIEEWVLPDGSSKHNVAIDRLIQLRIMIETVDRKKETTYRVNQTFQVNLQKHIVHGGTLPREPMPTNITVRRPSLQDLEAYAAEQWEAYNMNTLSDTQRNVIKDLADLGLAKLQQGRKESWFIPTKLATNLSISLSDLSSRKQQIHLPSLDGFRCAIAMKKTVNYIISFLQQNAHPRVAERMPSVPENVTDQIRLWESDMNRVEMAPAYYYDEFPSREVYEAACDYARQYGGLLWDESKRMRLVVKAEIHMHMREFLRREK